MKDKEYIIIRETLTESICADLFTFGCLIGSIAIGKWIDSSALQWIAGCMTILMIAMAPWKRRHSFRTIAEAKSYLDSLE